MSTPNTLYYGDNLDVLREQLASESVDLIYLDPPFNSQASYNILFRSPAGAGSEAQIEAFADTWRWGQEAESAFEQVMRWGNTNAADMLRAIRSSLRESDMMAYLAMMTVRLLELHRVLKPGGALYLHCDPTASHYLKIILDACFGPENFRSEIIWRRSGSHNSASRQFGPVHDTILTFSKTRDHTLRPVRMPHTRKYIDEHFTFSDARGRYRLNEIMGPGRRTGESGLPWRGYDPGAARRHWAIPDSLKQLLPQGTRGAIQQLDALFDLGEIQISKTGRPSYKQRPTPGVALQDVWSYQPGTEGILWESSGAIDADVKWLTNEDERLGYPTQKPLGLLERIVRSSSDPGHVVLDPFCGCGTTIHAAEKLGRRWIGIDITHLAINLIERRLKDAFPGIVFNVQGTPKDMDGARDLARRDKYQFQWWALSLIDAQPFAGRKKGADGGVDGIIYFRSGPKTTERAIVSVKGGGVGVPMVRDLKGVLDREKAPIGVFLTLTPPTRQTEAEAAAGGFHEQGSRQYPRLQIITIAQALDGQKPAIPLVDAGAAFRRATRETPDTQTDLDL